jgi:hypothetical protein
MSVIDEIIKDAMRRGDFDRLPGQGAPLRLDNDAHTPEEMRLAHKLMKDNEVVPEWIAVGKALDEERGRLAKAYDRIETAYHQAVALGGEQRRLAAETQRGTALDRLRDQIAAYNKRVLTFNLKLPPGIAHRLMLDLDLLRGG